MDASPESRVDVSTNPFEDALASFRAHHGFAPLEARTDEAAAPAACDTELVRSEQRSWEEPTPEVAASSSLATDSATEHAQGDHVADAAPVASSSVEPLMTEPDSALEHGGPQGDVDEPGLNSANACQASVSIHTYLEGVPEASHSPTVEGGNPNEAAPAQPMAAVDEAPDAPLVPDATTTTSSPATTLPAVPTASQALPLSSTFTSPSKPTPTRQKSGKKSGESRRSRQAGSRPWWLPEDVPLEVQKYWLQRYSLFSRFDEGIRLDREGWFSATPEVVAQHQARVAPPRAVALDPFGGVGGNSLALAQRCRQVVAVEMRPDRAALLKHNAAVYGLAERIDVVIGDFFTLAPSIKVHWLLGRRGGGGGGMMHGVAGAREYACVCTRFSGADLPTPLNSTPNPAPRWPHHRPTLSSCRRRGGARSTAAPPCTTWRTWAAWVCP